MIILDTTLVSEFMRGSDADPRVLSWARTLTEQPVTTVITRAELLAGVALLPEGRRRDGLARAAADVLASIRVALPMTEEAAEHYADIVRVRTTSGRPIGAMDALIAAIARSVEAPVATRDIDGFAEVGVQLVNPWAE